MRKLRNWVAGASVALLLVGGAGAALAGGGKSGSAHDPVNPAGKTRGWAKDRDGQAHADNAARKAAKDAEKAARKAARDAEKALRDAEHGSDDVGGEED